MSADNDKMLNAVQKVDLKYRDDPEFQRLFNEGFKYGIQNECYIEGYNDTYGDRLLEIEDIKTLAMISVNYHLEEYFNHF